MGEIQVAAEQACPSGDFANRGYRFDEASHAIEFCVELDSQDDREGHPEDVRFVPRIDGTCWNPNPVYDSRLAVAGDLVAFKSGGVAEDSPWSRLYADTLARAHNAPPCPWTVEAFAADARYNGFSPYQLAWTLHEGRGDNAGAYAITIRGTTRSARPAALEGLIFQPVCARGFLNPNIVFANSEAAIVHGGFAHAALALLLDDRYGILRKLDDCGIHKYARIFLAGHGQGAVMSTLVHAFLHHAMQKTAGEDVFGLVDRHYRLKSYAFAQPKPGNHEFAADFASFTQRLDNAIVINNHLDPVPRIPLTLQARGDVASRLPVESWLVQALQHLAQIPGDMHAMLGKVAEPFVRRWGEGYGACFKAAEVGPLGERRIGHSWNFQPAGHVLLLFGQASEGTDPLLQHHVWTYRALLQAQLH